MDNDEWITLTDSLGRSYLYNTVTCESSWGSSPYSQNVSSSPQTADRSVVTVNPSKKRSALVEGLMDKVSKRVFYFNRITGEAKWGVPTSQDRANVEKLLEHSQNVASNWIPLKDSRGRSYEYNPLTCESRWIVEPLDLNGKQQEIQSSSARKSRRYRVKDEKTGNYFIYDRESGKSCYEAELVNTRDGSLSVTGVTSEISDEEEAESTESESTDYEFRDDTETEPDEVDDSTEDLISSAQSLLEALLAVRAIHEHVKLFEIWPTIETFEEAFRYPHKHWKLLMIIHQVVVLDEEEFIQWQQGLEFTDLHTARVKWLRSLQMRIVEWKTRQSPSLEKHANFLENLFSFVQVSGSSSTVCPFRRSGHEGKGDPRPLYSQLPTVVRTKIFLALCSWGLEMESFYMINGIRSETAPVSRAVLLGRDKDGARYYWFRSIAPYRVYRERTTFQMICNDAESLAKAINRLVATGIDLDFARTLRAVHRDIIPIIPITFPAGVYPLISQARPADNHTFSDNPNAVLAAFRANNGTVGHNNQTIENSHQNFEGAPAASRNVGNLPRTSIPSTFPDQPARPTATLKPRARPSQQPFQMPAGIEMPQIIHGHLAASIESSNQEPLLMSPSLRLNPNNIAHRSALPSPPKEWHSAGSWKDSEALSMAVLPPPVLIGMEQTSHESTPVLINSGYGFSAARDSGASPRSNDVDVTIHEFSPLTSAGKTQQFDGDDSEVPKPVASPAPLEVNEATGVLDPGKSPKVSEDKFSFLVSATQSYATVEVVDGSVTVAADIPLEPGAEINLDHRNLEGPLTAGHQADTDMSEHPSKREVNFEVHPGNSVHGRTRPPNSAIISPSFQRPITPEVAALLNLDPTRNTRTLPPSTTLGSSSLRIKTVHTGDRLAGGSNADAHAQRSTITTSPFSTMISSFRGGSSWLDAKDGLTRHPPNDEATSSADARSSEQGTVNSNRLDRDQVDYNVQVTEVSVVQETFEPKSPAKTQADRNRASWSNPPITQVADDEESIEKNFATDPSLSIAAQNMSRSSQDATPEKAESIATAPRMTVASSDHQIKQKDLKQTAIGRNLMTGPITQPQDQEEAADESPSQLDATTSPIQSLMRNGN